MREFMREFWVRIYLVRHGHVQYFDDNHQPINPKFAPLSPQGIGQISLLATQLEKIEFTKAFCSTLPRSIQTTELLLQPHKHVNLEAVAALCEIKSGRLREIMPTNAELQIKNAYRYATTQQAAFMQGENWAVVEQRVITWLEQMLINTTAPQNILISAHDVVNRLVINWINGKTAQDIDVQEQDYGCLNILEIQIADNQIVRKHITLQNYTVYDPVKLNPIQSAMEALYHTYVTHHVSSAT